MPELCVVFCGRIGYAGPREPGFLKPHACLELHVEQGPVLEAEDLRIGVVENLQGISWQRATIGGTANHAGTTPLTMRRDAGAAATQRQLSHRRMTSGAGHDAQVIARVAPAAMILVPSTGGISHNPAEFTAEADLIAGAQVLLDVARRLSP